MIDRKNKRVADTNIGVNSNVENLVLEPTQIEIGSGYTVKISYDENERAVLDIKTYGQVDTVWLRRELKRAFPKIQVHRLTQANGESVVNVTRRKTNSNRKDF